MSSTLVDHLLESTIYNLENPIYTVDLDRCDGISEAEIGDLKKELTKRGYIFSDGRKNGWNRIWIKKP